MASTGLGAPDALARCHDALDSLYEIRYWQKIWQTLESTTLALAQAGHLEHAAMILGHLDAHSPGFGLEHALHFRDQARELIRRRWPQRSQNPRCADVGRRTRRQRHRLLHR